MDKEEERDAKTVSWLLSGDYISLVEATPLGMEKRDVFGFGTGMRSRHFRFSMMGRSPEFLVVDT